MSYHANTRSLAKAGGKTQGAQLARLAVSRGLSVVNISVITGASRTAVYAWFRRGTVSPAFKPVVTNLIKTLRAGTPEQIMALKNSPSRVKHTLTI